MARPRPIRFFAVAAASFAAVSLGALATIHALLHWPPDDPPSNYGTFLLRAVPPPRIIVDGGSNVLWGVAAEDLERRFRIRTVVVGDTAANPFEARLERLERHVRKGDVVVMALEWPYYNRAKTYLRNFAVAAFGQYNEFFRMLPSRRRLELEASELGLRGVWKGMAVAGRVRLHRPFSDSDYRQALLQKFATLNARRPHGDRVGEVKPRSNFAPCRNYIGFANNAPSPEAETIAAGLARLQERTGARVFIAWPAVAGGNCYDERSTRSRKVLEVRAAFRKHGIPILGELTDSAFPESAIMDTAYHLREPEARLRTRRLGDELERAGVAPVEKAPDAGTAAFAAAALARAYEAAAKRLLPLRAGDYDVTSRRFSDRFLIGEGWQDAKDGTVGSRGATSALMLLPALHPCRIRLASVPNTSEPPLLSVAGRAAFRESGDWIEIAPATAPIRLEFAHSGTASEIGTDPPRRPYALRAIEVRCGVAQ